MKLRYGLVLLVLTVVLIHLQACSVGVPTVDSIRDSKLFDRRIKETPRQKIIRECQQESTRFHVECTLCHKTDKADDIHSPDKFQLTAVGDRAQIMRKSPSFGLSQDCTSCHQTKFKLNRNAEKLFSPGGAKYSDGQKALKVD